MLLAKTACDAFLVMDLSRLLSVAFQGTLMASVRLRNLFVLDLSSRIRLLVFFLSAILVGTTSARSFPRLPLLHSLVA